MTTKTNEPTNAEHDKLIEVLKFTPRTYKISMWGYGGEKVMGRVEPEVWDYCMSHQVDLSDITWNDEDTVENDMNLEVAKLPFTPGQWYDCDSIAHVNGVCKDAGTIQITDENDKIVYEHRLEELDGSEGQPELNCFEEYYVNNYSDAIVFVGSSNEKGTFFEGEIPLTAPFDPSKLTLTYEDVDGEEIINMVEYDGEDIENWGGSTDGKSSDFNMYRVDADGEVERYAPEEKDWGHPDHGPSPDDWEKTPKFKFSSVKPTVPGWYSAVWKSWGTTYGTLYWNGNTFGEWEYGKFKPINGVETWQGYNWDTSDWANRPSVPPAHKCKCGWTGSREEMRDDDDYNSHCPSCDSTNVDWIDYDPDTAKGRKNRKTYIKEQA